MLRDPSQVEPRDLQKKPVLHVRLFDQIGLKISMLARSGKKSQQNRCEQLLMGRWQLRNSLAAAIVADPVSDSFVGVRIHDPNSIREVDSLGQ